MAEVDGNKPAAPPLRTQQILAGMLVAGVTFFLLVVLVLRGKEKPMLNTAVTTTPIVLMGLVFGISALAMALFVPGQVVSAVRGKIRPTDPLDDQGRILLGAHQTRLIITLAILEAAAFFNLIAVMLEGSVLNLGFALLLLGLMASQFPTRGRLENWLADQLDRVRSGA